MRSRAPRSFRIVLITDPAFGDDTTLRCVQAVAGALPPGTLCVQLRDKRRAPVSLRLFAGQLRRLTSQGGAALVINGQPHLARDVGADGVHVGHGSLTVEEARMVVGPGAWISVAAHDDDDVRRAVLAGADAVLVSAIYPTRTLSARDSGTRKPARGVDALRAARALVPSRVGVIALGGITHERVRECTIAGASGVAAIRALLASADPARAARAMHRAFATSQSG